MYTVYVNFDTQKEIALFPHLRDARAEARKCGNECLAVRAHDLYYNTFVGYAVTERFTMRRFLRKGGAA